MKTTDLTFWIVDDEPSMCQSVLRALEDFSVDDQDLGETVRYQGLALDSGEAFMQRVESGEVPHLLLLDSKLPGKDGIEVLQWMGKRHQPIVTIMITAYATLENAVKATKLGAFDFLAKPFTPVELRHAVTRATREILHLRRARQLEQEKRQVRFEFLSILAHELKSPLAALEGYVDLERQAPSKEYLDRMQARISGMRKLIGDLLDLTAIESGKRIRNLQPEDLRAVALQEIAAQTSAAAERRISMDVTGTGQSSVEADRRELEMLLRNLISNAIKYNRPGGSVTVDITATEGEIVLSVRDTGIGIAPADQEKLFLEFSRVRNQKTRGIEGSGLGLSIVRQIAGLYGAKIRLISEEDKGSTFMVIFHRPNSPAA